MTDPRMRLDAATTTLLVIDPQVKLMPVIADGERVTKTIVLLLRAARELGYQVVATTQYEKGLGPLVEPIASALGESAGRLEKTAFSCFDAPGFARLIAPGRTLLVAGVEAHICVAGSVLGALRAGHPVQVVTDAVSSRSPRDAAVGVARMERAGALVTTSEMLLYELIRDSRSAQFRAMLPHFRGQ